MSTWNGIQIPSLPVPTEEEKHKMTLEALKDIDEGRVISDRAMRRWLAKLIARKR
jgi:hypothetical protein